MFNCKKSIEIFFYNFMNINYFILTKTKRIMEFGVSLSVCLHPLHFKFMQEILHFNNK